jgi:carboxypeptidase D
MRFSISAAGAILALSVVAQAFNYDAIHAFKRTEKYIEKRGPPVPASASQPSLEKRKSKFLNANTKKFVVNGSAIPEVDFNIGESYAGLLPISQAKNEKRKLFFWFFPSTNKEAGNEIVIWFNGGPGCSSLSGLLTENGPFLWQEGASKYSATAAILS